MKKNTIGVKNSLVIMLNNPGDVVMAQLAMDGTDYYLLTDNENRDLFYDTSKVIFYPRIEIQKIASEFSLENAYAKIKDFVQELTQYNFINVFNLFQGDDSAIISGLLRLKGSTIFGKYFKNDGIFAIDDLYSKYLYTIPFNRELNSLHVVDIYKKIIGNNSPASKNQNKIGGYILIHISAAWESKRYSVDQWIEVIKLLKGKKIILTGTNSEKPIALKILSKCTENIENFVGKTTKVEFSELIKNSDIVISVDTFAIHLAAYHKIKSISLFGPTNVYETNSYLEGSYSLVSKENKKIFGNFSKTSSSNVSLIEPELIVDIIEGKDIIFENYNTYVFYNMWNTNKLDIRLLNIDNSFPIDMNLNDKIISILDNRFGGGINKNVEEKKHIEKIILLNKMIQLKLKRDADITVELKKIGILEEKLESFSLKYQVFIRIYRIEMNGASQSSILITQEKSLKKLLSYIKYI